MRDPWRFPDEPEVTRREPFGAAAACGRRVPRPGAGTDDRPLIDLELGELPAAVAECNRLLAGRGGVTYILGDVLVTLERIGDELQTVRATPARIGLELSRVARFCKIVGVTEAGVERRPCDPPMKLATAIAEEPGGWRVPVLEGLTEVPILRPTGEVVTAPGYDPTSRLYLHGGPFAPVPDEPGRALELLLDALSEFPFAEPHHRSAALALLLTAVIRRQLPSAPMFAISAREAGTGKGTLAQLGAILAGGRRAPETPWSGSAEEQRKTITASLLRGRTVLLFDNITDTLDSAPLCVLLTSESWADRVLGQSREVTLPAGVLVTATGNNLRIAGDLCRRVIPVEMDAKVESPELRRFGRDLIAWALSERRRLVAAALGIIAAHRRAGEPLPAGFAPLGSFESWSRVVCGALTWLGEPDPRLGMRAIRASDPRRALLHRVLDGMRQRFGDGWQAAGSILDTSKCGFDDAADPLREAIEEITARAREDKAARIMLGRWLETQQGRVVGGWRLEAIRDEHRKANLWRAGEAS